MNATSHHHVPGHTLQYALDKTAVWISEPISALFRKSECASIRVSVMQLAVQ